MAPRLITPSGATVNVSEDKATRLLALGYRPHETATPEGAPPAPAPTASTSGPSLADLKAQAGALGLTTSGTKAQLAARIAEATTPDPDTGDTPQESTGQPDPAETTGEDNPDDSDDEAVDSDTDEA